jgi:hypothetical protein
LDAEKPETFGFSLVEIAEAGLPELSPKEREGAYRLIAETADSPKAAEGFEPSTLLHSKPIRLPAARAI